MDTKQKKSRNMRDNKTDKEKEEERRLATKNFEKLVDTYYKASPFVKDATTNHELEVKFGTKGVKPFTKLDYDSVIKKLKSLGFTSSYEEGVYMLRVSYEYLDKSGSYKDSNIRAEITGFRAIQEYCKTNDISKLLNSDQYSTSVKFVKKIPVFKDNKRIQDVDFFDFNFRISYRTEEEISPANVIIRSTLNNWNNTKKSFRYINRVTFVHENLPINVDMSIVKSSPWDKTSLKKTYTTDEAGVFSSVDIFEMELEVDNAKIGPGTEFNQSKVLLESLRKNIKFVLMGLQGTNYPISIDEQKFIINDYMKLLHGDKYTPRKVYSKDFIGPSSYTLQIENIVPQNDDINSPNIRKNFVVTEKADGERHLMYISKIGKIYLINTNMAIIFTGAVTEEEKLFDSLYDGELILHNKNHKFINLFALFDVYYIKGEDVRKLKFMEDLDDEKVIYRYKILLNTIELLKAKSVVSNEISPMRFQAKKFYPENFEENGSDLQIFEGCKHILQKVHAGLFEYETDGLIFTQSTFGVGGDGIGKTGPLKKVPWDYSFKWKPPEFNTIDFLVVTKKKNGDDIITPIFQDGKSYTDLSQYKTIELRCGYNQKRHGYINPCQDVYEDELPEYGDKEDESQYKPVLFVPTKPYDPEAGICNIMLKRDDTGVMKMFAEDGEVFEDNTIVEFKYEMDREKRWRWVPIRVRNDKTTELKQGITLNYGNAYHVAQSNWKSIHNPIGEDTITTGFNISSIEVDEDVYYNRIVNSKKTRGLRCFHNYIKSILIKSVSNKGDTLIDYACGKGGDFSKWTDARLSFVLGIDQSSDNIENRVDGACARFLNFKKTHFHVPYSLFVHGDTSLNIRNGEGIKNDKGYQIIKAVFGEGARDESRLGKGVVRQYGKAAEGFQISSCQFALHYFFENLKTLKGFVKNVAECTKLGGYFIATAYDGEKVFKMLKNKEVDDGISIYEDEDKIWEIKKRYNLNSFENDSSCLGYKIDVFQESINKLTPEYLVNYTYFDQIMENFGFHQVSREDAKDMGLPEGSGLFSDLYVNLLDKHQKTKDKDFREAMNMNEFEKQISFLNRYVVYKKIRIVNTNKVILDEVEETDESKVNKEKEADVIDINDEEVVEAPEKDEMVEQPKRKIRKLSKKLIIVDDPSSSST